MFVHHHAGLFHPGKYTCSCPKDSRIRTGSSFRRSTHLCLHKCRDSHYVDIRQDSGIGNFRHDFQSKFGRERCSLYLGMGQGCMIVDPEREEHLGTHIGTKDQY